MLRIAPVEMTVKRMLRIAPVEMTGVGRAEAIAAAGNNPAQEHPANAIPLLQSL